MNAQPNLFDMPAPQLPLTIQERFEKWAGDNEDIIQLFLKFAREAQDAGHKRYGIKAIVERVRWEVQIVKRHDRDFYINNSFTSRLARYLVKRDPQLYGLFEFRTLKAN